ncbi:MAG: ammonium transporter [Proteobacteria bacterium]|nr:ammonium transporter [Pseudomonadota bacterium]
MKKILKFMMLLGLFAPVAAFADGGATVAPQIDSGNTAWLLVSSALVMLMTPGLALFYAGMVSKKNVVSTLLQNYIALALVGLIWVIVGYSLVFSEKSPLIGGFDFVMLKGLAGTVYASANVPNMAFMAFQMMFAIITPALLTGAFAERVKFKAWLIIMALWTLVVYAPVAHWVWGPKGWIADMGGLDFAGGLVVHITAGFSGLVAAILFGKRHRSTHTLPNDVPMVMLGAALLWFGWFGFNAGSAISSGALASHAFVLTFVGGATSFLAWMFTDWFINGKPSAVGSATGIVVGLVCITPAAGFVELDGAIIMCTVAGVVCNLAGRQIKKISRLDDALDVFTCHGIGAVIGSIMTGAYASKAVNDAVAVQGLFVSGETKTFMANLVGVVVVSLYSMVATYIIIKIVNVLTPIRASVEEQDHGLDSTMHGEKAQD